MNSWKYKLLKIIQEELENIILANHNITLKSSPKEKFRNFTVEFHKMWKNLKILWKKFERQGQLSTFDIESNYLVQIISEIRGVFIHFSPYFMIILLLL
jgi:hypothetical protein